MSGPKRLVYDVLISGGGAAGSALAHRLITANVARNAISPLRIGIIEPQERSISKDIESTQGRIPNARAYALSPSSLETLGLNSALKGKLGEYEVMQIWEQNGPGLLHFNKDDVSTAELKSYNALGAVVEDRDIVSGLWDALSTHENVDLISGASLKHIEKISRTDDSVKVVYEKSEEKIEAFAKLLVAADGGNSFVRNTLGMSTIGFGYGRRAVICTVKFDSKDSMHEYKRRVAYQRFFPNGPIALLPTFNDDYGNIVWSTTPEEASRLTSLDSTEFVDELNDALQTGPTLSPPILSSETLSRLPPPLVDAVRGVEMLGQSISNGLALASSMNSAETFRFPPMISSVEGRRFAFDLKLQHAKKYVGPRVALIGDAAHTIHPMAGQGLNLGLADAECLAKCIKMAIDSGMDIGSSTFLDIYESERQKAAVAMMAGIQCLHAAFSTEFSPAVYLRSIGVNFVNSATPLRQTLANVAVGNAGASVTN